MGETTVNKLPWPEDGDAPDGPVQVKALADALDVLKWGPRNLKPDAGVKTSATEAGQTITESYADVTGFSTLTITPAVTSLLLVTAVFDFQVEQTGSSVGSAFTFDVQGTVRLDSSDQTPVARLLGAVGMNAAGDYRERATVTQVYALALTAAEHTVKPRVKRGELIGGGSKSAVVFPSNTKLLYQLFAS